MWNFLESSWPWIAKQQEVWRHLLPVRSIRSKLFSQSSGTTRGIGYSLTYTSLRTLCQSPADLYITRIYYKDLNWNLEWTGHFKLKSLLFCTDIPHPEIGEFCLHPRYCALSLLRTLNDDPQGAAACITRVDMAWLLYTIALMRVFPIRLLSASPSLALTHIFSLHQSKA